jgi:hypothetical protein
MPSYLVMEQADHLPSELFHEMPSQWRLCIDRALEFCALKAYEKAEQYHIGEKTFPLAPYRPTLLPNVCDGEFAYLPPFTTWDNFLNSPFLLGAFSKYATCRMPPFEATVAAATSKETAVHLVWRYGLTDPRELSRATHH